MNDNNPTGRKSSPPEIQTLVKRSTLAKPGLLEVDFAELELRALANMSDFDWKSFQRSILS